MSILQSTDKTPVSGEALVGKKKLNGGSPKNKSGKLGKEDCLQPAPKGCGSQIPDQEGYDHE